VAYANELSQMHQCSGEMISYDFAETNLYDIEVIIRHKVKPLS